MFFFLRYQTTLFLECDKPPILGYNILAPQKPPSTEVVGVEKESNCRCDSGIGWVAVDGGIFPTMWGPRSIAKLVQITPITIVINTINPNVIGLINQLSYRTGASHCKDLHGISCRIFWLLMCLPLKSAGSRHGWKPWTSWQWHHLWPTLWLWLT